MAKDVTRNFELGFDRPACRGCRDRATGLAVCTGCRRPRKQAGERDGRPFCAECLPTGLPPLCTCVGCGRVRPRFTRDECEDCAWSRYNERLIARLQLDIGSPWCQVLFERYHRESRVSQKRGGWRNAMRKDVHFFAALANQFEHMHDLSAVLIVRRLGWPAARAHRRAMSFLAQQNLITLEDPDYLVEITLHKLRALIAGDPAWISAILEKFLKRLLNTRMHRRNRSGHKRVPMTAKSLESAVRAARALLLFAAEHHAAVSVQGITQEVMDYFLAAHRQYRLREAAFVHYLNFHEHLFHRIKLPKHVPRRLPVHLFLSEQRRVALIAAFSRETRRGHVHWALISVLMLVYAQTGARAVRLPLSALRESADGYQVKLAKVWLDIDTSLVPLVRRWLGNRGGIEAFDTAHANPYLFPGQRAGTHLRSVSLERFFNEAGVRGSSLRATALRALVQGGAAQVRTLIDVFGISSPVAQMYCAALNAASARQAGHAHHAYVRP